ncbi:MAG TPA: hypothetical protein VIQ29_10250 [Ancylobacter sp.]
MSQSTRSTGIRRTRDKVLFALAYGAVAAVVLFAQPFGGSQAPANLAALETPAR